MRRKAVNAETCQVTSDDKFLTTDERYRISFYKVGGRDEKPVVKAPIASEP